MANPRIDDLRRRLEKEPQSRLFAQLAEELRKDGDLHGAIRVARDGLEKHPAYVSARMTLGRALQDSGEIAGARAEFEAVLATAPDNILASRLLAGCLEGLGSAEAALARYRATLALSPGDPQLMARVAALEQRVSGSLPIPHGSVIPPTAAPVAPAEQDEWVAPEVQAGDGGDPTTAPEGALDDVELIAEAAPPIEEVPVPLASVDDAENFELEGAFEAPGMAWQKPEPEAAAESPELVSPTIGELYFNQGHTDRAIDVYRLVVEQDPGNERARARLAELEALERHLRAEEANGARRMAAAAPKDPREARRAALERTIGRLEGLMAAFKGGRP